MPLTYRDFLSTDEHRPGVLYFGGARMALLDIEAGFWGLRRQLEALVGRRLTDVVLQQAGANGGASFARSFVGRRTEYERRQTDDDGRRALCDCVAAYQAAGFGRFEIEALEWPIGQVLVRAWDTFEAWMVRRHGQQTESPVCAYSAGVLVGFVNVLAGRRDVVCIERACQAQGADSCGFELLPAEVAGDVPVVALAPDPALGRQLNLLEVLFDRMPMGIVILDRDLRVRRFNPTWAEFVGRYSPVSVSRVVPGAYFFDLAPDTEDTAMPVFQRVLAGETVHQEAFSLEIGGIVSYWDAVLTPLVDDGEVVGIVHVTTDATERVLAYQELEARVEARTRELEVLYRADEELHRHLRLDQVLQALVDVAVDILEADKSSLMVWDAQRERLVVRAARGFRPETVAQMSFALGEGIVGRVAASGEPIVVEDAHTDPRVAKRVTEPEEIRSFMHVPIKIGGQVFGVFNVNYLGPRVFGEEERRLFMALAQRAALAIENAQLYEQAQQAATLQERQRLARELHDAVTQTLFSASLIAEVLPRLWERDPDEGRRRLEELRQLTRGALAEMRTLLLELRPAALTETSLGDLLRQLAEAITGRARVPVTVEVEGECSLPPEVQVALYRIAQEALNNVAKHARANQATVSLHCRLPSPSQGEGPGVRVELRISDDGRGFDVQNVPPESLGLGIMRERAEAIGTALKIDSQVGHGTEVVVVWKDRTGGKR